MKDTTGISNSRRSPQVIGWEAQPELGARMMNDRRTLAVNGRNSASRSLDLLRGIVLLVCALNAFAQAPAAPGGAAPPMSSEELVNLVGPIALYPDDLVAIILPASTNPLQLVQAERYLEKRKSDPKLPLDDKWDDPVKSLVNYPDVVKMMSADLDWTTALGEAVVADQGAVIEAVEVFRRKAHAAGNLKSDDKQVVKVEKETVIIEPADPQVIYVPQYNPTTVVVASPTPVYAYYPTPYPSYYYPYPPGAALARGVIWGAAIGAAWSGNRYGCCGDVNVNVNRNTNVNRSNVNRGAGAAGGGTAWKSNKQPGQVSGSVGKSASGARVGDARGSASAGRASAQPASAARSSGNAGRGGSAGGDALGGYGSGRQAQMDSSRGASSRSSMSSSGARPSASSGASRPSSGASRSGGGARGGGGGGGGGGRGGGGRR
jgi:hypothetical protein